MWTEPNRRKVSVVYYLSRNGQLEHPHFIEVPLFSSEGLFLRGSADSRISLFLLHFLGDPNGSYGFHFFFFLSYSSSSHSDVINRLNNLRGKGMASMYCWSAKRYVSCRYFEFSSSINVIFNSVS